MSDPIFKTGQADETAGIQGLPTRSQDAACAHLLESGSRDAIRSIFNKGCHVTPGTIHAAGKAALDNLNRARATQEQRGKVARDTWVEHGRSLVTSAYGKEQAAEFGNADDSFTPNNDEFETLHRAVDKLRPSGIMRSGLMFTLALTIFTAFGVIVFELSVASAFWQFVITALDLDNDSSSGAIGFSRVTLIFGVLAMTACFHVWAKRNPASVALRAIETAVVLLFAAYAVGMGATIAVDAYDISGNSSDGRVSDVDSLWNDIDIVTKQPLGLHTILAILSNLSFIGMIGYIISASVLLHLLALFAEKLVSRLRQCYYSWEVYETQVPLLLAALDNARDSEHWMKIFNIPDAEILDFLASKLDEDRNLAIAELQAELYQAESYQTMRKEAANVTLPEQVEAHRLTLQSGVEPPPALPEAPSDTDIARLRRQIQALNVMDFVYFRSALDNPATADLTASNDDSKLEAV